MAQITFAERAKDSLRAELLDAATRLLPESGYAGLRMVDIAGEVGVSRQTVYNEFGTKSALAQAVVLRITGEFLDGVRERFADAPDLVAAVHRATAYTIERAASDKLVAAALGADSGGDLLPLLTSRGAPVLHAAADLVAEHFTHRLPELPPEVIEQLAETTVRLTLSHMVMPTGSAATAADSVTACVNALLEHHLRGTKSTRDSSRGVT